MDLREVKLGGETIYEGGFVSISRDKVRLPNGNEGQRIVIRHPGAACVLAVTDDEKVVLVRQWRYAANQATLLELPAGKLDVAGEDMAACALRELAEETPYVADSVRLLYSFYTAVGFCNEKMYLFEAEGVRLGSTLSNDEDEITETVLMSKDEVRQALANDEIKDGKTLIGLQYWLMKD
ncbi:NUDIX hydrolase [Neisseria gonorrhoeae]|uniref:NUDIX hydrolase n=1 Tax=Neisseria gonorrhoeae TaxID=485 RepID=UPI003364E39B